MEDEKRDFYNLPGYPTDESATFIGHDGLIEIENHTDIVWKIVEYSDGHNSRQDIVDKVTQDTGADNRKILDILDDLESLDILTDAREIYKKFHMQTIHPQAYEYNLSFQEIRDHVAKKSFREMPGKKYALPSPSSEIAKTAEKRQSCRFFENTPLKKEDIGEMLNGAYSREISSVPSAGGLYPIRLSMVVSSSSGEYPNGYYQYNHNDGSMILYNNNPDLKQLEYALNSENLLHGAPVLIVVGADLSRQTSKYANRGYRYTLLEAGHVAQNIHLIANELGLATLEYGGYLDDVLKEELQLGEQNSEPIIIIACGKKSTESSETSSQILERLDTGLVGRGKPINWYSLRLQRDKVSDYGFFTATAHYRPPNREVDASRTYKERFASGTSTSADLAQVKAIAEAFERYRSGNIRVDIEAPAATLNTPWLDPGRITPLSPEQLARYPDLKEFDENEMWQWVTGVDLLSGKPVMVPVDLVFYPITPNTFGRKLISHANSSGIAANFDEKKAVESGLLELIERDAIMRNWYSKNPPPKIPMESISKHWQRRITYWKAQAKSVDVLDLSHDGVAIVNVIIRNDLESYPYFVNGSAASLESYEVAVEKAFHEAELALFSAIDNRKTRKINPDKVWSPADHGRLYLHPELKSEIEWLWSSKEYSPMRLVNTANIYEKYRPVAVTLSEGNDILKVVRVFSTSLVPISFGYLNDYYLHPKARSSTSYLYKPQVPHYYA